MNFRQVNLNCWSIVWINRLFLCLEDSWIQKLNNKQTFWSYTDAERRGARCKEIYFQSAQGAFSLRGKRGNFITTSSSSSVKKLNHRMRLSVIIPHPPIIRQDKKQHTSVFCCLIFYFFHFQMTVLCLNSCVCFFKLEMSWHPPDSLSLSDSLWRTHNIYTHTHTLHTDTHTTHRYTHTHTCWIMGGRV